MQKSHSSAEPVDHPPVGSPPSPPLSENTLNGDAQRALFAVSSLGLGHATRTLVVIREYLSQGFEITVVSTGNALAFLRMELEGEAGIEFRDMPDYPPLERGSGWRLYAYLGVDLLRTWGMIRSEHRALQAYASDYDFIFSDGKYGFYSRWTPSFILSHQIAFVPPKGLRETAWLTENLNVAALKRFDMLFIPDYFGPSLNLAGNMSHSVALQRCAHRFVGILSSYEHLDLAQDIDYLFVISGYLVEHKASFVGDLLEQAVDLPGKKVFVLGDANGDEAQYARYRRDDLEIHSVASGRLRQELFNRARVVVSRSGYTTVMDLVEHDKRALLIPTPNQTEQEYLASYLGVQHYYTARTQAEGLDLKVALKECEDTRLFVPPWKTDKALRRITETIAPMLYRHFISVIVPAYNEEAEIETTLCHLLAQRYPADRYEIVLVENGSTDDTLAIARRIAKKAGKLRVRVIAMHKGGVSCAKNAGLEELDEASEWVVFLDADTRIERNFLQHLNNWLNRRGTEDLSVGTTSVRPNDGGWYERAWFAAYDVIHRFTRTSFSIQVARTQIARGVRFHEELNFAEDLTFIRECRRYGRFFFLTTDQVSTSTRRFDSRGYLRQALRWSFEALLPMRMKAGRKYDVVR